MAKLEVKENVVFAEVKESVSPYGEMMKLLKEYIDQVDSITYCDALPDTGETDHLYIVRTGEAYIYEGEWIQLTGGSDGITGISVNGTPQEVIDHVVDLLVPTKTSQLENDSDYTTTEAVKSEIAEQIAEIVAGAPESLDTLKEIADWIEGHASDAAAMNTAIKEAQETADNALTEAEGAQSTATEAQESADSAKMTASMALDSANIAQESANTKVSSVNIGTVTTGDSPSVTNSGTDKDVTLDFVFPSLGDARIECGEIGARDSITLEGMGLVVAIDDSENSGNGTCIYGFGGLEGASVIGGGAQASFAYRQITLTAQFEPVKYIAIIAD